MRMRICFTLIATALVFGVACSHAKFDDSAANSAKSVDSSSKKKSDEATKDLPQEDRKDEAVPDEPFSKNTDISKADRDELATAFKRRAEQPLIKAASQILSKDPANLEALNALAVHYFWDKKFGMAKVILQRALKDHPNEPALANNLGIVYLAEDERALAIEQFKKAVSARADYRIGATNLSSIYLEFMDYQRALAPLEESYRAVHSDISRGDSSAVEIANNYGVALIGVGDNAKAESVFSELMSANVRNPVPYLNYAILLVEVQKNKKDAIRVISKLKFMTDDREILRRVDELERKME